MGQETSGEANEAASPPDQAASPQLTKAKLSEERAKSPLPGDS
jgi:hypothetical protein